MRAEYVRTYFRSSLARLTVFLRRIVIDYYHLLRSSETCTNLNLSAPDLYELDMKTTVILALFAPSCNLSSMIYEQDGDAS